jgi:hypothetical protein
MRKAVGVVMAVLVLVAGCGGDDGEETREVELEPIAAVEACDLLDASKAAELAGADVEAADGSGDDPNVCEFAFADDEGGGIGSGIAASLRMEEGDESDVPGGSLARALSLGDAGAVETTDTAVKVVYVVREVVVRIEVTPVDGVDDAAVERVVEFAEETEAPVVEAVTGEAPAEEESTTTTEASTTTSGPTTTTTTGESELGVEELWGLTAVEHREQIGEQFEFDCPAGGTPRTVWGDHRTGYTDDSGVCTAAVHAGAITIEEGGTVLIQMVPGQDSYPSSTANGITTLEWTTPWPAGFLVLGAD